MLIEEHGFSVSEVAARRRGLSDKEVWALAAREGRVLVTRDLDFPLAGIRPAPPSVILLRAPDDATADQLAALLAPLLSMSHLAAIGNQVVSIQPGRMRMHPIP